MEKFAYIELARWKSSERFVYAVLGVYYTRRVLIMGLGTGLKTLKIWLKI